MGSGNPAFGGVERHVTQLANGLADAGHAVSLFMGWPCPIDEAHGLDLKVDVRRLPTPDGRGFPRFAGAVLRGVRRLRPCIVHTHLTYGLAAGIWTRMLTGVPVVHTEHFLVRKSEDRGLRGRLGAFLRGRAQSLICVSRMVSEHCVAVGGNPERRVIYSGVDPVVPAPTWRPSRRLLYLGRLEPDKQVGVLVDAMHDLCADAFVLDIVGTGSEEAHLRERAGDLVSRGIVRFHGWRADVGSYLEGAGALLLPAREALGYAALEATAYGVPVIAPVASGASEVVERTGRGVLVTDDGQPRAWAAAVRSAAAEAVTVAALPSVFERGEMIGNTLEVYQSHWHALTRR